MIVANQKAVVIDLRRQVAVAEMPGDPRKGRSIAAAHLDEILFRRLFQDLLAACASPSARALAQRLGGYDLAQLGKIIGLD